MRERGGRDRPNEPDEDRLRATVRVWRLISAVLILGVALFETWRVESWVDFVVGLLLAAAYWAILPRIVRFSLGFSAGPRRQDRPDRPV